MFPLAGKRNKHSQGSVAVFWGLKRWGGGFVLVVSLEVPQLPSEVRICGSKGKAC